MALGQDARHLEDREPPRRHVHAEGKPVTPSAFEPPLRATEAITGGQRTLVAFLARGDGETLDNFTDGTDERHCV
jgi:hypothetical protein